MTRWLLDWDDLCWTPSTLSWIFLCRASLHRDKVSSPLKLIRSAISRRQASWLQPDQVRDSQNKRLDGLHHSSGRNRFCRTLGTLEEFIWIRVTKPSEWKFIEKQTFSSLDPSTLFTFLLQNCCIFHFNLLCRFFRFLFRIFRCCSFHSDFCLFRSIKLQLQCWYP